MFTIKAAEKIDECEVQLEQSDRVVIGQLVECRYYIHFSQANQNFTFYDLIRKKHG